MTLIEILERTIEVAKRTVLSNLDLASKRTGELNPFGDETLLLDKKTEDAVINSLRQSGISFSIMTEEQGIILPKGSPEYLAIVDPIDGSANLERGIPLCSIGIAAIPYSAFMTTDDIEVSIISSFFTNEHYVAIRDHGATKNGVKISPSSAISAKDSIISYDTKKEWKGEYAEASFRTLAVVHDMRRTGSNLLDLCWTASGSLDAMVDLRNQLPIVHASGTHMVQEAGGFVIDSKGNYFQLAIEYDKRMNFVAAASEHLAKEILDLFRSPTIK